MNTLLVVENRLDTIETWPSYIIRFLFLNCPRPQLLRKLLPYFMGMGSHFLWQLDCIKSVTISTLLLLLTLWVTYIWNGRESIQTPHVSLLRCSTSAVPMDQRFVSEPDGICGTGSNSHGLRNRWMLFSTSCRNKTKYWNCGGCSEVTVMVFRFVGS